MFSKLKIKLSDALATRAAKKELDRLEKLVQGEAKFVGELDYESNGISGVDQDMNDLKRRIQALRKAIRIGNAEEAYRKLEALVSDATMGPVIYQMARMQRSSEPVDADDTRPLFHLSKDSDMLSSLSGFKYKGHGGYSKVYTAKLVAYSLREKRYIGPSVVIVKEPLFMSSVGSSTRDIWHLWEQLDHPNIIPLLGVFYQCISVYHARLANEPSPDSKPYLACPLALHDDCWAYLTEDANRRGETHLLIQGAIDAIAYMHTGETLFTGDLQPDPSHRYRICHGDIKPVSLFTPEVIAASSEFLTRQSNLLVAKKGHVWIADFDLAAEAREYGTRPTPVMGTARYTSPELLILLVNGDKIEKRYEMLLPGDVYALGITIWELMTLEVAFRHPHYRDEESLMLRKLENHDAQAPKPHPRISSKLFELIQTCWDKEMNRRPTAEKLRLEYGRLTEAERMVQGL